MDLIYLGFFFQAEDGIRGRDVTGVQTCALPISGGRPTASAQALLTRAITASDNAAAESLWSSLGPPDAAAAAVHSILAGSGDASTSVETRVLRPGFTSFGQTHWSLAAQQHFIAGLPCLANSGPVLSLMQQ